MSLRVHKPFVLWESDDTKHRVYWLGLDETEAERGILANQYLVVNNGEALIVDPGGYHVAPRIVRNVLEIVGKPSLVTGVYFSHQDPDVAGSVAALAEFFPNAKFYISELWVRFLPHLGIPATSRIVGIPDNGIKIRVGRVELAAIPAHFLHSPGNFTLYDPYSKILFSGDIGAAVFPEGQWYLFVDDFDEHAKHMYAFHKRYMGSSIALKIWLDRVRNLVINAIAPQHGAIFLGDNARKLIEWLERLGPVGIDLLLVGSP